MNSFGKRKSYSTIKTEIFNQSDCIHITTAINEGVNEDAGKQFVGRQQTVTASIPIEQRNQSRKNHVFCGICDRDDRNYICQKRHGIFHRYGSRVDSYVFRNGCDYKKSPEVKNIMKKLILKPPLGGFFC